MAKWPPKIAVTVGKFKPLHRGHELMVSMAAAEMDEVTVIVSDIPDDEYFNCFDPESGEKYMPLSFRYKMVKMAFREYPNVRVVKHEDIYGAAARYDEHGTAVDEQFWDYWTTVFKMLAPDTTHFVSSDRYGQEAAGRMDMQWFPVDPDRELVDISATRIRENPIANWRYINKYFRQSFGKRVLVIGPESTGKTTLTKDLGQALNSPVAPEYGRFLSEAKENDLDEDDFNDIVKRHHEMEMFAMRTSETGVAISDTDLLTTYLFTDIYLERPVDSIRRKHSPNWYDLVVILPPRIPWVDDGTRVLPDETKRKDFFNMLLNGYRRHKNLLILEETDRARRVDIVCARVAQMVQSEKPFQEAYDGLTKQDTSHSIVV